MNNRTLKHKNLESDTFPGHITHMDKKTNHNLGKENNQDEHFDKLCDDYQKREMKKEKENLVRKAEYREFLLKQMNDKDKKQHSPDIRSTMTPFSEDLLDATEKSNLKLQKQKEAKENLDECVKMKHDLRLQTQRTEFEEEQKRSEFWKKHDDDNINTLEKVRERTERKEHTKNEVALLWIAEKHKDSEREKFINGLIEKESITDLNKDEKELVERQKRIRVKKELLTNNEEKICELLKNVEVAKKEQQQLKEDIEREEEEIEQNLKLKSNALLNTLSKNDNHSIDEVDQTKTVLREPYQCANNRFFGLE